MESSAPTREREERMSREREKEKEMSPFNIPFPSFLAYAKDIENQFFDRVPEEAKGGNFYEIFGDISPSQESSSTLPTVTNRKSRRGGGEQERCQEGRREMTAAERRRENTDVGGKDFLIILFVGSSLWYGIYLALSYYELVLFSQIAYFISMGSFCLVFSIVFFYLLSKIRFFQRGFVGFKSSRFGKNMFSERFFVFLHHFLCVFYSFSLCTFVLPPLYDLISSPHPDPSSFSPSFYFYYGFTILLTTMWSSIYYQFRCHLSDPGIISSSSSLPSSPPSSSSPHSAPSSPVIEVSLNDENEEKNENCEKKCEHEEDLRRFCRTCKIYRPLRSKHCRQCDVCVYRMDHHCLYINNCVGANNHFSFVFFLCVETLHVLCVGHILYFTVTTLHEGEPWGFLTIFLTIQIVMVAYCWIGVVMLWFSQFFNMLTNWTTNERINWRRYPYLNNKNNTVNNNDNNNNNDGDEEEKRLCLWECYEIWMGYGHPFSQGPLKNTISMFNQFQDETHLWDQL